MIFRLRYGSGNRDRLLRATQQQRTTRESPAAERIIATRWLTEGAVMSADSSKPFTVKQAAERTGISASLLYELCAAGLIRHTRHGRPGSRGTIRISEEALAEHLKACEQGRREAAPAAV